MMTTPSVAKGMVSSSVTTAPGTYDFRYSISGVDVTGFAKTTSLDSYADNVPWTQAIAPNFGGTARFILKLEL
jgi:hypothetical protein